MAKKSKKKVNIKVIIKYTTNILAMVSAIIVGINKIEGIDIPYANTIVEIIAVITGVIGTYLTGSKISSK